MTISLITTVLNEGNALKAFLDSVVNQSLLPDEFIIVDGGSTDQTIKILGEYREKYDWIRILIDEGASIGKGRNLAIKYSRGDIIAVTDAGCVLKTDWLQELTRHLPEWDVSIGNYYGLGSTAFEQLAEQVIIKEPKCLPSRASSRSLAFKKSVWKEVGGYPDVTFGEDTQFNLKWFEAYKWFYAVNAVVYWQLPMNEKEFYDKFYNYGKGDTKTGNIYKMKKNLWFVRLHPFSSIFLALVESGGASLDFINLAYLKRKAYVAGVKAK